MLYLKADQYGWPNSQALFGKNPYSLSPRVKDPGGMQSTGVGDTPRSKLTSRTALIQKPASLCLA
jgi:hypothetical protein